MTVYGSIEAEVGKACHFHKTRQAQKRTVTVRIQVTNGSFAILGSHWPSGKQRLMSRGASVAYLDQPASWTDEKSERKKKRRWVGEPACAALALPFAGSTGLRRETPAGQVVHHVFFGSFF
ncbi:hypothetical protein HC256_004988 [Beauveria bassiana]|nr:hypothetical protein HC256_004988 [Beauveria bassiana]